MTKIEAIELKINEMQIAFMEEVKDLQKALAELKESKKEGKKEGKWKPKDDEKYWFRNSSGENEWMIWDDDYSYDKWRYNNIPIFKTEEECERYWHFMDTVKEKSYQFSKEEWEDETTGKYIIQYDHLREYFYVDKYSYLYTLGTYYFKTKEDAQYIIDNFKDELIEFWI